MLQCFNRIFNVFGCRGDKCTFIKLKIYIPKKNVYLLHCNFNLFAPLFLKNKINYAVALTKPFECIRFAGKQIFFGLLNYHFLMICIILFSWLNFVEKKNLNVVRLGVILYKRVLNKLKWQSFYFFYFHEGFVLEKISLETWKYENEKILN